MPRPRLKRILIVGLPIVAALGMLMLLPPVQTALVRLALGGVDGVNVEIGRVVAGPWGGSVEGVRLDRPGLEVSVARVEADIAFWSSLLHLALDLEEATATGVDIRLGPFAAHDDEELAEPFEFHGLAPLARVPRRVIVRSAGTAGTITVLASDMITMTGPWSATASNLGPNRRLEAELDSTLEVRRDGITVLAAAIDASLSAEIDGLGAVRKASGDGGVRSLGDQPVGLDAGLELELAEDAESYRMTIGGLRGPRTLVADAQFTPSPRLLGATWTATLTPGLVRAFARDRGVPELSGTSTGTATLELDARRLELDTSARIEGTGWGELDPRFAEIREQVFEAEVAGVLQRDRLEARRLRIGMTPARHPEILRLEALQPVTLNLAGWELTPEVWGEPALRIEMNRFPLRWSRSFDPAVVVEDGNLSGSLVVVPVESGHTLLETHEPIRVRALQLAAANLASTPPPLDISIIPRLEIDRGTLEAKIEQFEMTADTGLDARFAGGVTTSRERWPVLAADGSLVLRIPRLQRALESLDAVRGGARFDLDLARMVLLLDRGELDITSVDGHPLVAVTFENETPVKIELPTIRPDWASADTQELRVRFEGLPIGWMSPFIPEVEFAGGAVYGELAAVGGGGRGVTLEPVEPFEVRGLQPLYRGNVMTSDATVSLLPRLRIDNDTARISVDRIQVRTLAGGRLDGKVALEAPRDGGGRIAADVWFEGDFPAITGRIGRLGALSWRQQGTIDVPNRRVEVSGLELGLTDLAGTRFLELEALRPFVMGAEPFGVWVDGGSSDIVIATITPLELQQLFPRILGFELEGVLPQGQFIGRAENGGLLLAAEEELVFKDVCVRWQDAALLDRVTVGLTYQVVYSADGLQARSIDFKTLGPRGTPLADATLRAVMPLTDRTTIESLHFETVANLEPLTRQPIFAGLPAFLEGTVAGSLDLEYGDPSTLQGSAKLRGARVESSGALPDLDAALDVVSIAGEGLKVHAPVTMSSEHGRSDLAFEGSVRMEGDEYRFQASLTGDRLVASDVTRLVSVVSPPDPDFSWSDLREPATSAFRERWSKAAIEQLREQRDTTPFWGAHVSGDASLDLSTLQLARAAMTGIRGRISVAPHAIEMTGVEASMLGAHFASVGGIRFDEAADTPYTLRLDSSFTGLDLGQLFRAVAPDEPPTLEGVFEAHTTASGQGRNAADLGLGSVGELRVSGRDGVFRGMAGQYKWARRGTKALGILTFSKQLKAVSRLLDELEALEFDTFDLVLARETPQRFVISELSVVSPLARIEGSGGVEVEPGVPLVESPLDATFDMATQGDMTILFNGLGLLQEGTDQHGYRPLTQTVTVGGTVAEPDTTAFYEMLDAAARDSKGVVGVGMRKVNKKLQKAQRVKTP